MFPTLYTSGCNVMLINPTHSTSISMNSKDITSYKYKQANKQKKMEEAIAKKSIWRFYFHSSQRSPIASAMISAEAQAQATTVRGESQLIYKFPGTKTQQVHRTERLFSSKLKLWKLNSPALRSIQACFSSKLVNAPVISLCCF